MIKGQPSKGVEGARNASSVGAIDKKKKTHRSAFAMI